MKPMMCTVEYFLPNRFSYLCSKIFINSASLGISRKNNEWFLAKLHHKFRDQTAHREHWKVTEIDLLTGILISLYLYGQNNCAVTYLQNRQGSNLIGLAIHLLVSLTQGLYSNPGPQSKGQHVPLEWCAYLDPSPALGAAPAACFGLFFLWLWLV